MLILYNTVTLEQTLGKSSPNYWLSLCSHLETKWVNQDHEDMCITCLREVKGVAPRPGLEMSSYILLTGGAPLLSLWAGTTGCGGDPPRM